LTFQGGVTYCGLIVVLTDGVGCAIRIARGGRMPKATPATGHLVHFRRLVAWVW